MKISVCMATYNGARYVREQVLSILSQLAVSDELIISDDGSSDETLNVLNRINDSRIVILSGDFKNPMLNFENALKHASGNVVFLSDQDDIWLPDKVNTILDALKYRDLVFSNALIIDENGETLKKSFFNSPPKTGVVNNLFFNRFFGATMAFKRDVLCKALPFPAYIPMHDQWIGLIAACYFKVGYINKPLIKYRRHGANASFCGEKSNNSLWKKIKFRIDISKALVGRLL